MYDTMNDECRIFVCDLCAVGYGNECSVQECDQWWVMVMSVVYKIVVSGGIW